MPCYITRSESYLPGLAVENQSIQQYLGTLDGEDEIRDKVLAMNGIDLRHYAQDENRRRTHDVYELGSAAAQKCLAEFSSLKEVTFLAAGTTYAPLAAPGVASILHHNLQSKSCLCHPVEISSHAGICSSASTALVGAIRAINSKSHRAALCIGAEHASEVTKSTVIRPIDDRAQHANVRNSQWFMSVFLRFMLSDGAGAVLLQDRPDKSRLSLKVDWTHSMSFAHETPLCMKLDNQNALLSQDVSVLSKYLVPTADKFVRSALETHQVNLENYRVILPHMSSFFFRRKMERVIANHSPDPKIPVPYWTNLATAGNTGAASIFVMLDHYLKQTVLNDGEQILLFVPESGRFNYVMVSLTAVLP